MSRNLRLAHLPPTQPRLRWSGYLTTPGLTDAQVQSALSPFFLNLLLWRARAALPSDWPANDDSMIQSPPTGVTPIWGEGTSVSTAAVLGDPETPWRVLVGDGQLAIANVWLLDTKADPWPTACVAPSTPCPACQPPGEVVTAPTAPCHPVRSAVIGALLGGITTIGGLILSGRRV